MRLFVYHLCDKCHNLIVLIVRKIIFYILFCDKFECKMGVCLMSRDKYI
jgi:hypothetical protein